MEKKEIFLTAKWCNLIHISFIVNPRILAELTPPNIELDTIGSNAVVTLVAFYFEDTAIKGIPVPLYGNFPEINLRFNVKDKDNIFRGIVFIKELVPKIFVAEGANLLYNEKYEIMDIKNEFEKNNNMLAFSYETQNNGLISAITETKSFTPPENSIAHQIKQRNSGFGIINGRTVVYKVEHAIWEIYPVINYTCDIDFAKTFGKKWVFLENETPFDITVARGSNVNIYDWEYYKY